MSKTWKDQPGRRPEKKKRRKKSRWLENFEKFNRAERRELDPV